MSVPLPTERTPRGNCTQLKGLGDLFHIFHLIEGIETGKEKVRDA